MTVRVAREPLAADCRGDNNKQRLKALNNVVLKLCAAMFGLNYDELKQRHRERQMKRRLLAMSSALAIVTVFALTCLFFMLKISNQSRVIQDRYAGSMANASGELLSLGARLDALYAARSVLPDKESDGYNPDAYNALVKALAPYEVEKSFFPVDSFTTPVSVMGFDISEDSSRALIYGEGYFCVSDISSDKELIRVDSIYSNSAVLDSAGVVYLNDSLEVIYLDPATGNETILDRDGRELYDVPGSKTVLAFFEDRIVGYRDAKEVFSIDLKRCGVDDPDYTVGDVYIADDGKYAAFLINGFSDTWATVIDVQNGKLKNYMAMEPDINGVIACDEENIYICIEDDYSSFFGSNTSIMMSVRMADGTQTMADIAGNGFYEMKPGKRGILLISDRLAYVLDKDLNGISTISGYSNAVFAFPYEEGFVLLDKTGNMFLDNLYSDVGKNYELYGHNDSATVSVGMYKKEKIYLKYYGSSQVVVYSSDHETIEAMNSIGDARDYDQSRDDEIVIDDLEGIEDISVFSSALTGDGKYILVSSDDGILYVYDTADKTLVKEIYNSGILLLHKSYPYLNNMNAYAIESGLFDSNFNMISTLPKGIIRGVGNDEKSIVIESRYSPDTYYKIGILSYDEIINGADALLAGYVPDKATCDKYNIELP